MLTIFITILLWIVLVLRVHGHPVICNIQNRAIHMLPQKWSRSWHKTSRRRVFYDDDNDDNMCLKPQPETATAI